MNAGIERLPDDYRSARASFLAAARDSTAELWEHMHSLPGPDLGPLAISTAHINPNAKRQLLIVSGTHGVEGFAGSVCQTTMLRSPMAKNVPPTVGIFFVHALNPHGFAYVRRVNEDNVDLNRNFVDFGDGVPENPEYKAVAADLVPKSWDADTREQTTRRLLDWMSEIGLERAQEIITQGQYDFPNGLFFGGDGPSWSRRTLEGFVTSRLQHADRVAILDLHTGLGPRGYGELITSASTASAEYSRASDWYDGQVRSATSGESVSAALEGEWLAAAPSWLPDSEVTGVAIEWGTVDGIEVLDALRGDAWLHANADMTHPQAPEIKQRLKDAFAPDDPEWLAQVCDRFVEVVRMSLAGLIA